MPTILRNGQSILFVGASIVDFGRRDLLPPLGDGFVRLFAGLLAIREPEKRIEVINKGIGGNKVADLRERWHDDVIPHDPDHLVIQVGMNDILSLFSGGFGWEDHVIHPDKYEKTYDEILSITARLMPKCRIVLIDPFYISTETNPNSPESRVLAAIPGYVAAIERLSRKHKTRRVQTHAMFQRMLKAGHSPEEFSPEHIHPNTYGHLAIAEGVYEALSK